MIAASTEMTAQALRETLGGRVWESDDAADLFGAHITSGEFWTILFDSACAAMIKEAVNRYYPPDKVEDCFIILSPCHMGREFFGVAILRRRAMLAPQLRQLLLSAGIRLKEREILRSKVLIAADRPRQPLLGDFCREVFGDSVVVVGASDLDAQKIFTGGKKLWPT